MSSQIRSDGGPVASPRGEIKALTGLRAVAAAWVVLYHLAWLSGPYLDQLGFLRPVLEAGWSGVELFFVLSGFVIARSYLDTMGARFDLRGTGRFLYNRLARVWPAYALTIVLAFAWMLAITRMGWAVHVVAPHPEPTLRELAAQLTLTEFWGFPGVSKLTFNLPGWSIASEWLAYLAFPLLALLVLPLRRLHPVVLIGLATAAMVPLFQVAWLGSPTVVMQWWLRIGCCFVAGLLACLAARGLQRRPRADQWGLWLSVSSLTGIVLLCFWASWRSAAQAGDYVGVMTVLYPALVVGLALTDRGPARLLAIPPLVYGGRISYALYLVHFLVMDVLVTWYWQDEVRRGVVTPGLAMVIPLMVLVSIGLGAAVHHGVEEPARKLMLSWLPATAGPARAPAVAEPAGRPEVGRPRPTAVPAAGLPQRPEQRELPTQQIAAVGPQTGRHLAARLTVPPPRVRPAHGRSDRDVPETVGRAS